MKHETLHRANKLIEKIEVVQKYLDALPNLEVETVVENNRMELNRLTNELIMASTVTSDFGLSQLPDELVDLLVNYYKEMTNRLLSQGKSVMADLKKEFAKLQDES